MKDSHNGDKMTIINVDQNHTGSSFSQAEVNAVADELRAEGYTVMPEPLKNKILIITRGL